MNELKVIHDYTFDEVEVISTHSNGNSKALFTKAVKLDKELKEYGNED